MSDETTRRELTARLDSDLYEQLREATYKLRISKQQAMIEALKMWLGSTGEPHSSYPDSHIPTDMLTAVDWIPEELVPVIEFLIEAFSEKGSPEEEMWKDSLRMLAAQRSADLTRPSKPPKASKWSAS
jgi:hypothetical protein